MGKKWPNRILIATLIVAVLAAALMPLFSPRAQAAQDLIRLTVENYSTSNLRIWLDGPKFYYFTVAGDSIKTFTIERGKYKFKVYGCGTTVKGTWNLNYNTRIVNPVCGGNTGTTRPNSAVIDLGRYFRVVPITISNEVNQKVTLIMTGPTTVVFVLKPNEERHVTVGKGTYTIKYTACGAPVTRKWEAYKNRVLYVECP
jgi:DNA-directed RNA polymerase subunit N (RpoN/RPB10)